MNRHLPSCALVTGASRGLGEAIARECAARGARLLLVALPESGLPRVSESIARAYGVEADWIEADLTERSSLDRLLEIISDKRLSIDLLVNNAGIGSVEAFAETPLERHEATIELNALALVRLTRLLLPAMPKDGSARILNVASLGASFPMPTMAVYSATKSFVLNFSLALRAELAGCVGVSALCPNAIRMTDAVEGYVDGLGLVGRLACLPPETIARIALDGAARGAAVIVPGAFNRALAAVARFAPRALVQAVVRRYWGGFGAACGDAEAAGAPR